MFLLCYRRGITSCEMFQMATTSEPKCHLLCHLRPHLSIQPVLSWKQVKATMSSLYCMLWHAFFPPATIMNWFLKEANLASELPPFSLLSWSIVFSLYCAHSEDQRRVAMAFLPTALHSTEDGVRDKSSMVERCWLSPLWPLFECGARCVKTKNQE